MKKKIEKLNLKYVLSFRTYENKKELTCGIDHFYGAYSTIKKLKTAIKEIFDREYFSIAHNGKSKIGKRYLTYCDIEVLHYDEEEREYYQDFELNLTAQQQHSFKVKERALLNVKSSKEYKF